MKPMKLLYDAVKEGGYGSSERNLFWNDKLSYSNKDEKSFVDFIHMYTDKTSKALKTNSLLSNPIHVTLINFSDYFRRHLIDHGHALLGFLLVGFQKRYSDYIDQDDIDMNGELTGEAPLQVSDYIPLTSYSTGRNQKMSSIHQAMKMAQRPLSGKSTTEFSLQY